MHNVVGQTMCRAPEQPTATKTCHANCHVRLWSSPCFSKTRSRLRSPRVPIPVVLALLPLLPRSCYLNRGYTVWFHLLSLVYCLTRAPFVRRVLVLQGAGICLGWYAALAHDWLAADGAFGHTLYRNMPGPMLAYMAREEGPSLADGGAGSYALLDTQSALAMRCASHVLDLLLHPGLLGLFWASHRRDGGTLSDLLTWPVLLFAWLLSRVWSLVHSYHNTGVPALWYYGHDVYVLRDLTGYCIAYVAEGACFAAAVGCRVCWDRRAAAGATPATSAVGTAGSACVVGGDSVETIDTAPGMVHSVSGTSTSSMMS